MFTIALGASLCQNPSNTSYSETSTYKSSHSTQKHETKTVVTGVLVEPKANPKPKRDEWRNERGLLAQTQATKWAGWLLFVSSIMAVLSAFGIYLVIVTLNETRIAGEKLAEQNTIALNASRAEFQPYLSFDDRMWFKGLDIHRDETNAMIGATATRNQCSINVSPRINVINRGKTPATDIFVTHTGRLFNSRISHRGNNEPRQIHRDKFDFDGSRIGPTYLGAGEDKPLTLSSEIVFDRQWLNKYVRDFKAGRPVDNSIRDISLFNGHFNITITISFSDQLSKERRAFVVRYIGRVDDSWVNISGTRELKSSEPEYKSNQDAFESFKEATKELPLTATLN